MGGSRIPTRRRGLAPSRSRRAWVLLAAGTGAFTPATLGCPGDDYAPKDGDAAYEADAFTCTCDCYSAAVDVVDLATGDGTGRIDVNNVCVPSETDKAAYCRDTVCPLIEIFYNDVLSSSLLLACDATCAPAPENGAKEEAVDGVSRSHGAPECIDRCDAIECDSVFVLDTDTSMPGPQSEIVGNQDACTYAEAVCMDVAGDEQDGALTSDLVCRGDERAGARVAGASRRSPRLAVLEASFPRRGTSRGARLGCLGGRAEFVLLPTHGIDRDGDGEVFSVLRAIQVAGAGRLTDDAWITAVHLSSPLPTAAWAVRPGQAVSVDDRDRLLAPGEVAVSLRAGANDLSLGTLGGGTSFLLDEVAAPAGPLPALWLEWTCADSLPATRSAPPAPDEDEPVSRLDWRAWSAPGGRRPPVAGSAAERGYAFTLAEVGCPVDWPQLFTLRADDLQSRPLVTLELFGSPSARRAARVESATTSPGHDFEVNTGGLVVRGTILAAQEDQALVDIREVSYLGLPACVPGRYALAAL